MMAAPAATGLLTLTSEALASTRTSRQGIQVRPLLYMYLRNVHYRCQHQLVNTEHTQTVHPNHPPCSCHPASRIIAPLAQSDALDDLADIHVRRERYPSAEWDERWDGE